MITVIDTATTGTPDWHRPLSDQVQPRVVQLAAIQFNADGTELNRVHAYLKRDGWISTRDAEAVHGIPGSINDRFGIDPAGPLKTLMGMVQASRAVASYGIRFDRAMVEIEMLAFARSTGVEPEKFAYPKAWQSATKRWLCIKEHAGLAIGGSKAPPLKEAAAALINHPMEKAHNAVTGVEVASRIMWALVERKVMEI